jgi:Xaa-Pro dipeptidase
MTPAFAAFPESVHRERLERARGALREVGAKACICVSPEQQYYLGGYDSWTAMNGVQGMIFASTEDDPTLIVRDADLPLARETTWMRDVRSYHLGRDDPVTLIAAAVEERTSGGVCAIELESRALPPAVACALVKVLRPRKVIDASGVMGALRLIKDRQEIKYLRTAARYTNAGLRAAASALAPGMSEIELASAIEGAVRSAGSDYPAIPTELASGARGAAGHGTPREREIQMGELIHIEFAGVHRRYHTVAIQTLAVGRPAPRSLDLYRLACESLKVGVRACRPGATGADVEGASRVPLERVGLGHAAMMRFGYGVGIAYPPTWLEGLELSEVSQQRLEAGMMVVLHSCLQLTDDGLGVLVGGTYLVTDQRTILVAGAGACPLRTVGSDRDHAERAGQDEEL